MSERASNESVLAVYRKTWDDFTLFVKLIERIFDYMNRYSAEKMKKLHTTEVCFYHFKSNVFMSNKRRLIDAIVLSVR